MILRLSIYMLGNQKSSSLFLANLTQVYQPIFFIHSLSQGREVQLYFVFLFPVPCSLKPKILYLTSMVIAIYSYKNIR